MEEVLGVVGGGVAAKAELPSRLPLQCRCLRRALSPSSDASLAWSARRLEVYTKLNDENCNQFG